MRGEYSVAISTITTRSGSPPLARGIPKYFKRSDQRTGITPACAGNTWISCKRSWKSRDHPRLRGEYRMTGSQPYPLPGSPPLARGILLYSLQFPADLGITPACAGNTIHSEHPVRPSWDHPRLRGEYSSSDRIRAIISGSPPLARGILSVLYSTGLLMGITPACAGNTYV